ncbi:MAG: hypothetical protein FWE67_02565 [Planctomycetaceae bacterium]|nr:hypothetical protein [Planctomycetaceae bacterium]
MSKKSSNSQIGSLRFFGIFFAIIALVILIFGTILVEIIPCGGPILNYYLDRYVHDHHVHTDGIILKYNDGKELTKEDKDKFWSFYGTVFPEKSGDIKIDQLNCLEENWKYDDGSKAEVNNNFEENNDSHITLQDTQSGRD